MCAPLSNLFRRQTKSSTSVYDGSTFIVGFTYDGMGRRTQEVTLDIYGNPVVRDFYYSGTQDVEEYLGGQTNERNVFSPVYVNAILLHDKDTDGNGTLDQRVYFSQDANFNTTGVFSATGTTLQYQVYTSYGVASYKTSTWSDAGSDGYTVDQAFQGMKLDAVSGFYFTPNRLYSADMGVWLTSDPIMAGINWYEPDDRNPVNLTDWTGLSAGAGLSSNSGGSSGSTGGQGGSHKYLGSGFMNGLRVENYSDGYYIVNDKGRKTWVSNQPSSGNKGENLNTLLNFVGKVWNLPNTAVGLTLGTIGSLINTNSGIEFQKDGIAFLGSPFVIGNSALTLGNTTQYGTGGGATNTPQENWSYVDGKWIKSKVYLTGGAELTIRQHEIQHQYQGEILGSFYIPAMALGITSGLLFDPPGYPECGFGPANFMEVGPRGSSNIPFSGIPGFDPSNSH